jgi:adenine phosphoribosyltransferase
MHVDALVEGDAVLVADDVLATGGTAEAALKLIEGTGASVIGCCFVIELPALGGRKRIEPLGVEVFSLVQFEGD